mmetsp:Transcript_30872/g.46871  ORF Transcript_30872/g.46871 Transcript_30872/m.46871 type:complete len:227 (-) Transcript_30872:222-902(-)|eukprot:CAMPEP_0178913166 /NCGR_PEP_ID=MMETSP0786-20121207/10686_1 /TAXON_ID=186022 /ORGANISM="Thalassionema frauenfeldii, Strain CCMP 1798" /LENGTH=226 /DNA_ID=CAMNT_0020585867 /DNA_START=100 /DNA_END=780 /DNA_ORIENTATION=-
MRVLSYFAVAVFCLPYLCVAAFHLQKQPQQRQQSSISTALNLFALSKEASISKRNERVNDMLEVVSQVGQVGSLVSDEEQDRVVNAASQAFSLSDSKPARASLSGEHRLLYSAAPGASSGKLGPFVGKVTQFFEDDKTFYNRVNFGPLRISLKASREVKNDSTIKVSFLETKVTLFGQKLVEKQVGGGGIWKVKFVGRITDETSGKERLIRIMETPSLFVLEQPLN